MMILGPLDNDICITVQACSEPKDLIRGCVMPAPIGFCVAMLGGICLCYLDVSIGVCVLDYVIHQPNWKKSRGLTTVFLRFGTPRWKQGSLRGVKAVRGFPTSGSL